MDLKDKQKSEQTKESPGMASGERKKLLVVVALATVLVVTGFAIWISYLKKWTAEGHGNFKGTTARMAGKYPAFTAVRTIPMPAPKPQRQPASQPTPATAAVSSQPTHHGDKSAVTRALSDLPIQPVPKKKDS